MTGPEKTATSASWRERLARLLVLLMTLPGLSPAALAQRVAAPIVPISMELFDANGVSLLGPDVSQNGASFGSIRISEPAIAIGDPKAGGLVYQRSRTGSVTPTQGPNYYLTNNDEMQLREHTLLGVSRPSQSTLGTPYVWTTYSLGGWGSDPQGVDTYQNATSTRRYGGATSCLTGGGDCYYREDGAVIAYQLMSAPMNPWQQMGRVTSLTKLDGEVITWNYYALPSGPWQGQWRLQSVTNNLGYMIHFEYEVNAPANLDGAWRFFRIKKVTALDTGLNPCGVLAFTCSDSTGANWPYLQYGVEGTNVSTVTDRTGNVHRFIYQGDISTTTEAGVTLVGYRSPNAASDDIAIQYSPLRVTNGRGQWTYTFTAENGTTGAGAVTQVAGPNGYAQTIQYSYEDDGSGVPSNAGHSPTPVPLSATTNGRTMTYEYLFTESGIPGVHWAPTRLKKAISPEGDFEEYDYATEVNIKNIVHVRRVAKSGSGLADIHAYASYPAAAATACSNPATCNSPLTSTDPRGAVTSYTYDLTHGGLLTETKPAPGSGPYAAIQPQTRYTYDATGGITRVATVKSCRTTASCAGTADETVVETTYNAKRMPSLVVTRAGNNATAYTATNSRVASTYTPQGDIESVDGPLSGATDTVWTYYDTMRRPRVTVGPDPDGAGALFYRATRTTYDADGQPTLIEQGAVAAPSNCSAANSFCPSTMVVHARSSVAYDTYGRKVRENLINNTTGSPEAVTQYEYDSAGLVKCVATRMNPAVFASLPAACSQSTTGSFGADPIVTTTYNANGDPTLIQSGFGTTLVRNERQFTYLAPGQVATLTDAANNRTTYEYDGFNRLKKLRYPSISTGAGTSSTTDYEEYGYDAASNRTSERRRDGLMIANTYDALNRLRLIDKPGAELDVTNSYDSFSNLITASQTGSSVTWAYDALGRVTSEAQGLGTVSYTYDTAGRRTQLTYPGSGFFVNYQYFDDGKLKLVGLNGATTGADVLATYYDDQLGRRTSMCRGTGTTSSCSSVARTTYSYDPLSRLSGLAHDLITGTSANDASWTLAYSPASQLTSRSASSALYEWPYSATFTDPYTVNGLNQYLTVAGQGLAYDGRGNTTNDTTRAYNYDSSNMLTGSPTNGAVLSYDPTGRLLSITLGGVTTKFLYDGTELIAEFNGSNTLLRRYVHGDGVDDPIVWYDSAGTTNKRNLFKDERGSVVAADTDAAVTAIKYDEYGNATIAGTATPRFQYTGQVWLPELNLYYYKARIYNPDLGRFMQTDPIGTKDQVNLYAYVGNDPFSKADPSGMSCSSTTDAQGETVYSCRIDVVIDVARDGKLLPPRPPTEEENKRFADFNAAYTAAVNDLMKNPDRPANVPAILSGLGAFSTTAGQAGESMISRAVAFVDKTSGNRLGTLGGPGAGTAPLSLVYGNRGLGSTEAGIVHEFGLHGTPEEATGGLQDPSHPLAKGNLNDRHQEPYNAAACTLLGIRRCGS